MSKLEKVGIRQEEKVRKRERERERERESLKKESYGS